jgi:large subunit ribosomal protein L10
VSRKLKELIERDLHGRYEGVREALLINVVGLNGHETNRLRGLLRERKLRFHVVRNRSARRALAESPLSPLLPALRGPCALVTGETPAVEAAKELVRLATEYPRLELKVGLVEGWDELLPVTQVAELRGRTELIGDVLSLTMSPGRRVVGCLSGPGRRLAGCIKAIADRLEKGETISRAA